MQVKYYQLQVEIAELNYKLKQKSDELKEIRDALLAAVSYDEFVQAAYRPKALEEIFGFKLF